MNTDNKRRVFRKGQQVWVNIPLTEDQKKRVKAGERMIVPCGYAGEVTDTDWPFIIVTNRFTGSENIELRANVTHS
jgi:hypothetical protein